MTCSTDWPCVALSRADLALRTTMRVGGQAEWLLEPTTPWEFEEAYRACLERGLEVRVLGGGANLVVDDGLLPGVVIATERMRRIFRASDGQGSGAADLDLRAPSAELAPPEPGADPRLVAWAGCTLPALLRAARDLGFSGLEGIVGVPGNVGGGVAMNAGGRWGEMWDVIETVRVLQPDGAVVDLERADCAPRYRDGGLGRAVVLGAVMRFELRPKAEVSDRMREYLLAKNRVQPVTEWSAGCIFKNPDPELSDGRSAGKLVEDVGGKQLRRGPAVVSPRHGNFIVNTGGASATQVFGLMEDLQGLVLERAGVELEFEVKRWRPHEQS